MKVRSQIKRLKTYVGIGAHVGKPPEAKKEIHSVSDKINE